MGHWVAEYGSIILPTAEVAKLRKQLREKHNQDLKAALAILKEAHEKVATADKKDPRKYVSAMDRLIYESPTAGKVPPVRGLNYGYGGIVIARTAEAPYKEGAGLGMARDFLVAFRSESLMGASGVAMKPTAKALHELIAPATSTTQEFSCYDHLGGTCASISFDGRTLIWDAPEERYTDGNPAVAPLAMVLFEALENVKWTRATGGGVESDSEYNESANGMRRGASLRIGFGPIGEALRAAQMGVTVQKYRKMFGVGTMGSF